MQIVKKLLILTIILSFPFILSINTLALSASNSLRITPAYISLTEKAGSKVYENLSIFNNSNTTRNIDIYSRGIKYEHKKLILINSANISNIENWISIKNTKISIQPHKTQNIPINISVPKNEKYGSYNGGIVIANMPLSTSQKNLSSKIINRIIVNVFINIRGKNKGYSNLNISNIEYNAFTFTNHQNIKYSIYNPGPYNNAFIPKLYISTIFSSPNVIKGNFENILDKQIRYNNLNPNLNIGLNNIKLTIQNIGDNKTVQKSFYIIYIPKYLINVIVIIILLILIGIFIKVFHKYRSSIKH